MNFPLSASGIQSNHRLKLLNEMYPRPRLILWLAGASQCLYSAV